jgi:hypothetical protein
MAHYIVRAKPKPERLAELNRRLGENAFLDLRPFGKALTHSLNNAKISPDGNAVWEEEDYCSPPLAQERAAVLDTFRKARKQGAPAKPYSPAYVSDLLFATHSYIALLSAIRLRPEAEDADLILQIRPKQLPHGFAYYRLMDAVEALKTSSCCTTAQVSALSAWLKNLSTADAAISGRIAKFEVP